MLTKADFSQLIRDSLGAYPDLQVRYRAGDPIILQHLEAIAAMFGLLAQQIEVAQGEAFLKARPATVLADAAMRGIVPQARPAQVAIIVVNAAAADITIDANREVVDPRGRPWTVTAGAIIPANGQGIIQAEQRQRVQTTHIVTRNEPFYAIEIPAKRTDGQHLAALTIQDEQGLLAYADHYTNVASGERVYHVEADERQRLFARFGMRDVVGIQPTVGQSFALIGDYSFGAIAPSLGSRFDFAAMSGPYDSQLTLTLDELIADGRAPLDLSTLRELAKYPSIYNDNAVYLGEFEFLVRRHFSTLKFLSVWNERVEEKARGPDVDNINVLFVSCLSSDEAESVLTQSEAVTDGATVADSTLTPTQEAIRAVIARADDSYRVRFITPLKIPQTWRIEALIGSAYHSEEVRQRLREAILSKYGIEAVKRSVATFPIQEIYAHVRQAVPEIAEPGADVSIYLPAAPDNLRPEAWRYVDPNALEINVITVAVTTPAWGW